MGAKGQLSKRQILDSTSEPVLLSLLEKRLKDNVIGQDDACSSIKEVFNLIMS